MCSLATQGEFCNVAGAGQPAHQPKRSCLRTLWREFRSGGRVKKAQPRGNVVTLKIRVLMVSLCINGWMNMWMNEHLLIILSQDTRITIIIDNNCYQSSITKVVPRNLLHCVEIDVTPPHLRMGGGDFRVKTTYSLSPDWSHVGGALP